MNLQFRSKYLNDDKHDTALFQLPFFGDGGSIKKIVEDGNYLFVTRYNVLGEDGVVLPTPKSKIGQLNENCVSDLKKYLERNHSKYLTNLSEQSKKVFHKKRTIILAVISILVAAVSALSTILISNQVSYLFLTMFFVSFIVSCTQIHELKEIFKEEDRQKFIHQYKLYFNKLNQYNIQKEKSKGRGDTRYSSVRQQKENKVIDINKKKIKEKEKMIV